MNCSCTSLRAEDEFSDYEEFRDFEKVLNASGLEEIPVTIVDPVDHHERWYRCPKCKRVWSLYPPDFPFPGGWGEITLPPGK